MIPEEAVEAPARRGQKQVLRGRDLWKQNDEGVRDADAAGDRLPGVAVVQQQVEATDHEMDENEQSDGGDNEHDRFGCAVVSSG